MQEVLSDMSQSGWLSFPVVIARLVAAAVFGAVIGFEREWRRHAAGLRTHMLVSLAAATFGILGIEIIHSTQLEANELRLDPIRLIEAVTAGVAFLAAGTIIVARGRVRGLTTGAGMWLAGAIGLASGLGFWWIAGFATLLAFTVLAIVHEVERKAIPEPGSRDEGGRSEEDGDRT